MIQYKLSDILEVADRGFKTLFSGFDFLCTSEIIKVQVSGKNTYLELVEYDKEGKVSAKARGCIFDEQVSKNFLRETKLGSMHEIASMKILFHGKFSFHKDYGFSIIIDEVNAEYTLGQMQKKQDDIVAQLQKLGILYKNKQQELGFPPYSIAVISGQTSAGLKDFLTVLEHSQYRIRYEFYYCAVNGNNAMQEVSEQLQLVTEQIAQGKNIDAVAIIRGGGGSTDIIWQNDLTIATAICHMPVPVIVAVGHTPDKFILQDIARYGAKTPTDAAYLLINQLDRRDDYLMTLYGAIQQTAGDKIEVYRENIDKYYESITARIPELLKHMSQSIHTRYTAICSISPKKLIQSGYALLMQQGEYITKNSADELTVGDTLEIQVYDKSFEAKITGIK